MGIKVPTLLTLDFSGLDGSVPDSGSHTGLDWTPHLQEDHPGGWPPRDRMDQASMSSSSTSSRSSSDSASATVSLCFKIGVVAFPFGPLAR